MYAASYWGNRLLSNTTFFMFAGHIGVSFDWLCEVVNKIVKQYDIIYRVIDNIQLWTNEMLEKQVTKWFELPPFNNTTTLFLKWM